MAVPETISGFDAINDAVAKLQRSARQTIPMFLVGILATVIAAGVALYYILTLSADLREARHALRDSQAALAGARLLAPPTSRSARLKFRDVPSGGAPLYAISPSPQPEQHPPPRPRSLLDSQAFARNGEAATPGKSLELGLLSECGDLPQRKL
jgi:hypothetical protein